MKIQGKLDLMSYTTRHVPVWIRSPSIRVWSLLKKMLEKIQEITQSVDQKEDAQEEREMRQTQGSIPELH